MGLKRIFFCCVTVQWSRYAIFLKNPKRIEAINYFRDNSNITNKAPQGFLDDVKGFDWDDENI